MLKSCYICIKLCYVGHNPVCCNLLLHLHISYALVVWPGMLFPNSCGFELESNREHKPY